MAVTFMTDVDKAELQGEINTKKNDDGEFVNYNRFDKNLVELNKRINSKGEVVDDTYKTYCITDYIPCRTGKYVILSSAVESLGGSVLVRGVKYYNINKESLDAFSADGSVFKAVSTRTANEKNFCYIGQITVEDCYYVRLVIPKIIMDTAIIEVRDYDLSIEKWVIEDGFGHFKNAAACLDVGYAEGEKVDVPFEKEIPYWRGKTIVWNGDSISAGYGSRAGYHDIVAKNLLCTSVNCSYPSGTLAVKSGAENDRNPLVNRYADMPDNADLVCIAIGTNDWCYSHTPFGSMTPTTEEEIAADAAGQTFYGALKLLCKGLLKKYIGKPIVFFTPIKRIQVLKESTGETIHYWERNFGGEGKTLEDYANAIKEVCGYYGIPVLDLFNECLINPVIEEIKAAYIPDGTHPNIEGHKILARRITGYIKQLADGQF